MLILALLALISFQVFLGGWQLVEEVGVGGGVGSFLAPNYWPNSNSTYSTVSTHPSSSHQ